MKRILFTATLALIAFAPRAMAQAGPMESVRHFLEAFNKGDAKAAGAACVDEAVIIDEFPPYEWHGTGGCTKWMDAYASDAEKNKISDGVVALGKPLHEDVTGSRAYIVLPAVYKFKKNGKPVVESDAFLTIALVRDAEGWRIAGWAWTKRSVS